MPTPGRVIEAAGGVVLRGSSDRVEVTLVHRPRYDDWTLPLGRREVGESLEACALREVAEETGFRCRVIGFLATLTFGADDGEHRFHLYEMERLDGAFVPNPETDRAEWFPIEDAITRATYPNIRELLSAVATRPSGVS